MKPCRVISILMMACVASAPCIALGQARNANSVKRPAAARKADDTAEKRASLEAWLNGLSGHYRLKISTAGAAPKPTCEYQSTEYARCEQWGPVDVGKGLVYTGSAECRSIGEGPGVRCFFQSEHPPRPGMPMVMLLGVEAGGPAIRILSVDLTGNSHEARGSLSGNRIRLENMCPGKHRNCARPLEINARKQGQIIDLLYSPGPAPSFVGNEPWLNRQIEMTRYTSATPTVPGGERE